jgi:hypothetical protein
MGINIFEYDMPELKNKLVKKALKIDKSTILKEIRKYPFKPKKGFRRIDTLPLNLITKEINGFAKDDPKLANIILKIWFESEKDLREKVSQELVSLGYLIQPLQFDSNGIKWKCLNETDLLKNGSTTYFAPKGKLLDSYDPTECTLMAISNGWFDCTCQQNGNENIDNSPNINEYDINIPETSEQTYKTEDDISEKKEIPVESGNVEELLNSKTDINNLTTDRITNVIDSSTKYETSKKEIIETFTEISNELLNDVYKIEDIRFTRNYKELRESYEKILSDRKELINDLKIFSDNLNHDYDLNINLSLFSSGKQSLDDLKQIISNISDKLQTVLSTNKKKISELIDNIDEIDRNEITKEIKKIDDRIKNNKFEDFNGTIDLIESTSELISIKIQENNLNSLVKEFENSKSDKLFSKIFNYVYSNSDLKDKFVFYFASSKNIDSCLYLENKMSDFVPEVLSSIDLIVNENCESVYTSILQDSDLINPILKTELGEKYIALLSIYFTALNNQDASYTYIWNVKDSLNEYESIKKIIDKIIHKSSNIFTNYNKQEHLKKLNEIKPFFEKETNRYKILTTITHKVLKEILNNNIFPELEEIFNIIDKSKNESKLLEYKIHLEKNDFALELYNEMSKDQDIDSHNEEFIRQGCLKEIEKIKKELLILIDYKIEEILSIELPSLTQIKNDLTKLISKYPELGIISNKIISSFEIESKAILLEKSNLDSIVEDIILHSNFFAINFTNVCCELIEKDIDNNYLLDKILKDVDNTKDPKEIVEKLVKCSNYTNSSAVINSYGLKDIIIDEENDPVYSEMLYIESRLKDKGNGINQEYFTNKERKRYGKALNILIEEEISQKEFEMLSSREIQEILNNFKTRSLELKNYFFSNKDSYLKETYLTINTGLNLCEKVSDEKIENKIEISNKIFEEIEYLKINNDSTENLKNLLDEFDSDNYNIKAGEKYLQLPLNEIQESINNENFTELGLSIKFWNDLKDSRKEDIDSLLENWFFLKNKSTTYNESQKHDNTRNSLQELSKSLARICNLYITNNDNKIGIEPFEEWRSNKDIPFVFTTKIINPNSEPLNQVIRIYFLTDSQLGSKAYINKIRDHINDKKYNLNSFSLIFLIGDRSKFNKLNTNSTTRDLPILDELALKKIIFANETKKLPKWEFTNLLILTKKISDIQPFKSEGSVNSEVNIFVGRENIIKEMISVPKDFAIFGGRMIGKSSLLYEIKRELKEKGFITIYTAFQGYSDSISAAKSILLELNDLFKNKVDTGFSNLDDFKMKLKQLYNSDVNQPVAIFLDEVDELIVREKDLKEHKLIEIFRDIAHETNHKWIFVFAGFKRMYLEISAKANTYEGLRNPWANFVDSSAKNLTGIENSESLVNHGLKDILGLEFDSSISKLIVNYSSGHPAFLQYFCQCLVDQIKDKIDHNNRRIYLEDVEAVFNKKDDFINFVRRTLVLNLSDFQRLLIFIAADSSVTEFDYELLEKRLKDWLEMVPNSFIIDPQEIEIELELLIITGVIKKSSSTKYKFTHDYYLNILKRIEQINKNVIENLINKITEEKENDNKK